MTYAAQHQKAIELINEVDAAGAGLGSACREIGICLRTLKRWRKQHPNRWSRSTRSWRQREVDCINQSPDDHYLEQKLTF